MLRGISRVFHRNSLTRGAIPEDKSRGWKRTTIRCVRPGSPTVPYTSDRLIGRPSAVLIREFNSSAMTLNQRRGEG